MRVLTMTEVRISDGERAFVRWRPEALVGDPVDIDVHADGRCTPTVVWANGIK